MVQIYKGYYYPDSQVHGANGSSSFWCNDAIITPCVSWVGLIWGNLMGPTWVLSVPDGPLVGPCWPYKPCYQGNDPGKKSSIEHTIGPLPDGPPSSWRQATKEPTVCYLWFFVKIGRRMIAIHTPNNSTTPCDLHCREVPVIEDDLSL